jgi:hypothetical protein
MSGPATSAWRPFTHCHLEALVTADPSTRPVDLDVVVAEQFGVVVHPRSIGRALARRAEARARQGAPKTG